MAGSANSTANRSEATQFLARGATPVPNGAGY